MKQHLNEFTEKTENFLKKLSHNNSLYEYRSCLKGANKNGENLRLGYSCFALKIYFTLGLWDELDSDEKNEWSNYLNSFQSNIEHLPKNSFIDENLILGYKNLPYKKRLKNYGKLTLNYLNLYEYKSDDLERAVRAESKQAIASLYQVDKKNNKKYIEFKIEKNEIQNFLSSLDWSKPWSAGAEFANLSFFNVTQITKNKEQKEVLYSFITSLVSKDTGLYHSGETPSPSQSVNGAMKVLSGLDWLEMPIHYPEKLIDYCLNVTPNQEGCDLVDLVYVLYRSSNETNYKRKEIIQYLEEIYKIIDKHYYPEIGGFSYYLNKSQIYYYGLITSKGYNSPDIHGTILLTWALSMMLKISEDHNFNWNIIKP